MLGPGVYSAGDIAHCSEALGSQIFGDAKTAATVVTVNEQVFIPGQFRDVFRDLPHGNVSRSVDLADLQLVGFADIDELDAIATGFEQCFCFGNGDF